MMKLKTNTDALQQTGHGNYLICYMVTFGAINLIIINPANILTAKLSLILLQKLKGKWELAGATTKGINILRNKTMNEIETTTLNDQTVLRK